MTGYGQSKKERGGIGDQLPACGCEACVVHACMISNSSHLIIPSHPIPSYGSVESRVGVS
jgi:hypothetical protein